MARISLEQENHTSWYIKLLFWYEKRKYGAVLEPILAWSKSPKLLIKFLGLWKAFNRKSSPLSPELRSLVSLYVSKLNHCSFCIDLHSSNLNNGSKIKALDSFKESNQFSESEKAALEYARQVSTTPVSVIEESFSALQLHFSDQEIVELTALISFQNMSSRFNAALDLN